MKQQLKLFSLNPDLSTEELTRLKHHVSILGYKSVRDFGRLALLEKMDRDMAAVDPAKRHAIETVLANLMEKENNDSLV